MTTKEWRVVSARVFGTFRVFGDNETLARQECVRRDPQSGSLTALASDPIGPYHLQSRPIGIQGDDTTWINESIAE